MIININNICTYYSLFILFEADTLIKVCLQFIFTIKATIIVKNNHNYCRYIDKRSYFCKFYYNMIIEKKILKLGFANYINILFCQKYPNALSNLIFIEKTFIPHIHPILLIIILRFNSSNPYVLYY